VLVATPGRLLDLVGQGAVDLRALEVLVLDEADRMLDMGFIHDIKRIVSILPKDRQTLFFSATMPQEITRLADQMLRDPAKVSVTPPASTAERIEQRVIHLDKPAKCTVLTEILKSEPIDRVLVFTRTKHGADKVVRSLQKAGMSAEAIHGNKSQNQRERVLGAFRSGQLRTLIATDIAARGIDVDGVSHVINYDLPNVPESYVHRIGRTARAGAEGVAISFCDHEERGYLRDIERLIRMSIPATDRRTGKPVQAAAPHHSASGRNGNGERNNGRNGERNNGRNGEHNGGPHQHARGGHKGRNQRPQHGGRPEHGKGAPRPEPVRGEPKDFNSVRFMQRPGEPRHKAGHRAPR
jgi:superfamily II DNA/RNA helicase